MVIRGHWDFALVSRIFGLYLLQKASCRLELLTDRFLGVSVLDIHFAFAEKQVLGLLRWRRDVTALALSLGLGSGDESRTAVVQGSWSDFPA